MNGNDPGHVLSKQNKKNEYRILATSVIDGTTLKPNSSFRERKFQRSNFIGWPNCFVWKKWAREAWRENWWADPECNSTTEDGPPSTTVSEYLECVSRPNKWMDPWLTYGAANVMKRNILVWKFAGGK